MNITFQHISGKEDLKIVERLGERIWREHYIPIIGIRQVEYMLRKYQSVDSMSRQIKDGARYFTIELEGERIGYLCLIPEVDYLFISKFYVLNEYRAKGIGKQSVQFIETQARKLDLSLLKLTVNKYNSNSIEFYKKVGFENIASVKTDIGQGFFMDDYVMEKVLA